MNLSVELIADVPIPPLRSRYYYYYNPYQSLDTLIIQFFRFLYDRARWLWFKKSGMLSWPESGRHNSCLSSMVVDEMNQKVSTNIFCSEITKFYLQTISMYRISLQIF